MTTNNPNWQRFVNEEHLTELIAEAVAAERERCAVVCENGARSFVENWHFAMTPMQAQASQNLCANLAAQIRSGVV